MEGLEADRLLIRTLCAWARLPPSQVASRAHLAASTILRAYNGTATTRISQPTLEKLQAAFPEWPGWRGMPGFDGSPAGEIEHHNGGPNGRHGAGEDLARFAELHDAVLIPEVEVSYSMGGGSVVEDWPVVQRVPFSRSWLRNLTPSPPSELMVARGEGDSMMPTILDQDLCIIDLAQKTPRQQDRIWAMSYGGLGMIKRLRQLPDGSVQINSDNREVSPIHAVEGEVVLVGRVVGVVRKI